MSPSGTPTLGALPAFLRLLATFPSAETVMTGLISGPLAPYGVRTCRIWVIHDGSLVAVVGHGHTPAESDRYAVLPGELDLALWRAVHSGEPVITGGEEHPSTDFGSIDRQFWARLLARVDATSVVRAPLMLGPEPVGAIGFITDQPWPDGAHASAVLASLTSSLALWLSNPRSGGDALAASTLARAPQMSFAFTPRQREILLLVESGSSNPEIALALRVSVSAVKQDLQSVMRALGTNRRAEAPTRARRLGLL
jgi:DNA-binding CsgD family transcriptional regulator